MLIFKRTIFINCFFAVFVMLSTTAAVAQSMVPTLQVDRYSTVSESATAAQINPLLSVSSFRFPQHVTTVHDAVDTVLQYSGYALADEKELPPALTIVLSKPLPMVDRNLGPLTIQACLLVLVGKGFFTLQSDPINRTVNFRYIGKPMVTPKNKITVSQSQQDWLYWSSMSIADALAEGEQLEDINNLSLTEPTRDISSKGM